MKMENNYTFEEQHMMLSPEGDTTTTETETDPIGGGGSGGSQGGDGK